MAVVALALVGGGCSTGSEDTPPASGGIPAAPAAGTWKPWVLAPADQIKVPAPPKAGSAEAKAELAELKDLGSRRTPEVEKEAQHWSAYPSIEPWVKENVA